MPHLPSLFRLWNSDMQFYLFLVRAIKVETDEFGIRRLREIQRHGQKITR